MNGINVVEREGKSRVGMRMMCSMGMDGHGVVLSKEQGREGGA